MPAPGLPSWEQKAKSPFHGLVTLSSSNPAATSGPIPLCSTQILSQSLSRLLVRTGPCLVNQTSRTIHSKATEKKEKEGNCTPIDLLMAAAMI